MCPVRACAELVKCIYSEKIQNQNIPDLQINIVMKNGKLTTIPSSMILTRIRSAVRAIGKEKLGFTDRDVGTHSNRLGGAMGMYLVGTPVYTIMLLGCWSFNAFMRYIRKQVLDMSHRVSAKMVTYEKFYTIPDFVHNTADGDLRTRNNKNLATTTSFNSSHMNMRRGTHPAFHLER